MAHVGSTETERKYSVSMQGGEPISFLYGPPELTYNPLPSAASSARAPGAHLLGRRLYPWSL